MTPTWHRNETRDGVVLGFAKLRARLMVEGRAAAHSRSRIVASLWMGMSLSVVISLPHRKPNCFFRDEFGFLRQGPNQQASRLDAAVHGNNSKGEAV